MSEMQVRRVFEVYVDELVADSQSMDEMLIFRLRYFTEDVSEVTKRLQENPSMVLELMAHLSRRMQELDAAAGEVEHAHGTIARARSLALLLPETAVHEDVTPRTTDPKERSDA